MGTRLQDGDRVAIVGGGPAGSFAALHLLRLAEARGLHLDITVYEPHHPTDERGPRSCKGCAGILSASSVSHMAGLGLTIPPEVIQSELKSYVVHLYGHVTTISQPDPRRTILSVYRGSGPRLHQGAPLASFDAYLLDQARQRGVRCVPARVRSVEWEDGPVVCTETEREPARFLVLATGINSRTPLSDTFGYRAPGSAAMVQDELVLPDNWPHDKVAGFFGQPDALLFGAMVPKGRYLNVSLLWRDSAPGALQQFYGAQADMLRRFFPDGIQSTCSCNPRIVTSPASGYYGDRWVAVGDSAVSRLYKEGINSAFLTSESAMRCAVERGIGAEDFAAGYAPLCRSIAADNVYGKMIFELCSRVMPLGPLAKATVQSVSTESGKQASQRLYSRMIWGMLTGDESYRSLFWLMFRPDGMLGIGRKLVSQLDWR